MIAIDTVPERLRLLLLRGPCHPAFSVVPSWHEARSFVF